MLRSISAKSAEMIEYFANDFYSSHSKGLISDNIRSLISKSIIDEGEDVDVQPFTMMINSATELMTEQAISSRVITLDEKAGATECYLDSISQVCNKYAKMETTIRRDYARAAIETGKVANYEDNSRGFERFMKEVFGVKTFSKDEIQYAYNNEIDVIKSTEEENIIESIKEKVKENITETEEKNKLYADIIDEVEDVKKDYDDGDTTDGKTKPTEEEAKQEDDGMGGDDMGGDLGGDDMGGDAGDPGMGLDESETDIPTGDEAAAGVDSSGGGMEGYDATNLHSNRSSFRKGMQSAEDEEEDIDVNPELMDDYSDDIDNPHDDDGYKPPVENEDFDKIEEDIIMNHTTEDFAQDWSNKFAREEEEVMREIEDTLNITLNTQDDEEAMDNQVINPLRGTGDVNNTTDEVMSEEEFKILKAPQIASRMVDSSLLKYSLLPTYSSESMTRMLMKLDQDTRQKLKEEMFKKMRTIESLIYSAEENSHLEEKYLTLKKNWEKAQETMGVRLSLLADIGLAPRRILATEDVMVLSITKNLLNKYHGQKLGSVCERLNIEDEKVKSREKLIDDIFIMGDKAHSIMNSYDIRQAREDYMDAEAQVEKDLDEIDDLDEKEADLTDNLKAILNQKSLSKFFKFDDILLSYDSIFATTDNRIKLSDALTNGEFGKKVVDNLKDKRGDLSKEELDIVDRYIKGKGFNVDPNIYGKFNLLLVKTAESREELDYAQVAVQSKLLTTIHFAKEALLPKYNIKKDIEEIDQKLAELA